MSEETTSSGPIALPKAAPIQSEMPYRPFVPGTNGQAVASLCLGIFGFFPVAGILALIFGISALSQLKTRVQQGKGLAVGGLCAVGVWWLTIGAAVVVTVVTGNDAAPDDGTAASSTRHADAGSTRYRDLRPGDCVTGVAERSRVTWVKVVRCADPHTSEVVGRFELPEGPYPGDGAVAEQAAAGCRTRLAEYAPNISADDARLLYLPPSSGIWRMSRVVVCLAYRDVPYVGSMQYGTVIVPARVERRSRIADVTRGRRMPICAATV